MLYVPASFSSLAAVVAEERRMAVAEQRRLLRPASPQLPPKITQWS
jgi:hypothetical protein